MKKIILILCAVAMLFTAVACDSETTEYIDFNSSSKKNKNKDKNQSTIVEEIIYNTVSFQTNGGSNVPSVTTNKLYDAPYTTRDGYEFEGWFLDQSLTVAAVFPIKVNNDMVLYAKWLKTSNIVNCSDCSIKLDSDYESAAIYSITPSGFNINRLQEKGYRKIKITVRYDVRFIKDYNVIGDIGYFGAPKYQAKIIDSDGFGDFETDRKATKAGETRTLSYSILLSEISNNKINLKFTTNNIQNIVVFENIVITYEAVN